MKEPVIALVCVLFLSSCQTTAPTIKLDAHPDRPAAIVCPPSGLHKETTDRYVTNKQGERNLVSCLSDVARYVDDSNSLYDFFTINKSSKK